MRKETFLNRYLAMMAEDIDPKLKNFYRNVLITKVIVLPSFEEFVGDAIQEMVKTTSNSAVISDSEELSLDDFSITIDEKKSRSIINRRTYYQKKFYSAFMETLENEKRGEIDDIIGDKIHGMVSEELKFYITKIEEWRNALRNKDVDNYYLIDYPFIDMYNYDIIKKCFSTDIAYNIVRLSRKTKYKNFVQALPNTGVATYSGDNTRKRSSYTDSYEEEIQAAKAAGYTLAYKPNLAHDVPLRVDFMELLDFKPFKLNEKCKEIITWLTNQSLRVLKQNHENQIQSQEIQVAAKVRDVCEILSPDRDSYSTQDYKRAIKYLLNIAYFRYSIILNTEIRNIGFISEIRFKSEKDSEIPNLFYVSIGEAIIKDIVTGNLSYILTGQLEAIENPTAKLLYTTFRTDRLYDLSKGNKRHCYGLIQLQMAASVSGSKKIKEKKYLEAINEMGSKDILVHSVATIDEDFYVEWQPLSAAEEHDIYDNDVILKPSPVAEILTDSEAIGL